MATLNIENSGALSLGRCWKNPFPRHSLCFDNGPLPQLLAIAAKTASLHRIHNIGLCYCAPVEMVASCMREFCISVACLCGFLKNRHPYCWRVTKHSSRGRNLEEGNLTPMVALALHRAVLSMHFSQQVPGERAIGAWLSNYFFPLATPILKCMKWKAQNTCHQARYVQWRPVQREKGHWKMHRLPH